MLAVFMFAIFFVASILLGILTFYFEPKCKAKLFNDRFGTNYTLWDFICAEDLIKNNLHEGEQKTINLTGIYKKDGE